MNIKMYIDGSSLGNPGPSGIGIVIKNAKETEILHEINFPLGKQTNNEAEYQALIWGVKAASCTKAKHVDIFSDSKLVVNQINGLWKCNSRMLLLHDNALNTLVINFRKRWTLTHIRRELNSEADYLAKIASTSSQLMRAHSHKLMVLYKHDVKAIMEDVINGTLKEV